MVRMVLRAKNLLGYKLFIGILIDVINEIRFGTEVALMIRRIAEANVVWQRAGLKQSVHWHIM